jgi:putative hydrolase of the HAD superfamily
MGEEIEVEKRHFIACIHPSIHLVSSSCRSSHHSSFLSSSYQTVQVGFGMDSIIFAVSAVATCLLVRRSTASSTNKSAKNNKSLQELLLQGLSLNADERVCTVTAENLPLEGGHTRAEMRLQKLWHRATYCLVRHEPAHLPSHPNDDIYVIIQKRSTQKDYCPGKWDPTPGGVVGYGEEYQYNIERELDEEMGIDCTSAGGSSLKHLFTFPYQDDSVRVFGGFFECTYRGTLHDLKLQEEEVDEIVRINLQDLKDRMKNSPGEFMPDSIHAMDLYLQHQHDQKVQRRFLKGSSSDLSHFRMRPKLQAIFFDCDDCLYFDNWKTAKRLTKKIDEWCTREHGLPSGQAYQLYKQYGTALRGLLAEGYLKDTPEEIDRYLETVHDIGVDRLIAPDPRLQQVLARLDPTIPRFVFTASVEAHARRCIRALGIEELFDKTIIDCKQCDLETKHSKHSFAKAMEIAGVTDPQACLFLDDSLTNIQAARHVGWRSILVGKVARDTGSAISSVHAEMEIATIHEIEKLLPELFLKLN